MNTQFDILRTNRTIISKIVSKLSLEELHKISDGFNNNIAWNVAHLVVTQQLLHYNLSNLNCLVPDDLIENYRKGTKPTQNFTQDEWEEILELFVGLPDTLQEDYEAGIFETYNEYPTSTGFVIKNIDSAIAFNNFHEGIHLGSVFALLRNI